MKSFPIEKYRFYTTKNKIIAVSTYAGKTVKGVAKCAPGDEFDIEKGKQLAAARCNEKIAYKRFKRAAKKGAEAIKACNEAEIFVNKMRTYIRDASVAHAEAMKELNRFEELI